MNTSGRFSPKPLAVAGKRVRGVLAALLLLPAGIVMNGCGSGGYAGSAISSLSASSVTIDAGQQFSVTATNPNNLPISWSLSGSSCSGSACGTVSTASGLTTTYIAPASLTTPMQVTLSATILGTQSGKTVAITVNPAPAIAGTTPNGTVGTAYSTTLTASGGTGSLTLSLAGGSLPAGLTFNASTGVISGTPTAAGTSNFVVQVVDQSSVPDTISASYKITISTAAQPLSASGTPPAGVVGTAYSSALQATGGVAPYTWTVASGSLPAGLSLSTGGVISGTPTAAGTSSFTAQVQDSVGTRASVIATIAVTSPQSTLKVTGTLPGGTVGTAYSSTIGVSGGTSPYTCTVMSGTLPAGLTITSGCTVSGTPTVAGTSSPIIRVVDSSNPAQTTSSQVSLTIGAAASSITVSSPPSGTAGTPYTGTIPVSGGTGPYSCTITAGSLPAGLTLGANCTITGTPTTPGSTMVTVTATDSSTPVDTGTAPITVTINAGAALSLTLGAPPAATVNTAYSGTVPVTGGSAPYACTLTSGTLPAGLTLGSNCVITGTPTASGTSNVTISATDASTPTRSGSNVIPVTVNGAAGTVLTLGTPPAATVNTPYTGTVPVSGGTGPYACIVTSGALPAGLSLNANCVITGTPTTAGSTTVTVKSTDSANPVDSGTGSVTVTVNAATASLTLGTPPAATVNVAYSSTVPVSGGTGPYACNLIGGTLPAGLTLGTNCVISGTPTTAGTTNVTIAATDASSPTRNGTGVVPITVNSATINLTLGTPPAATVNTPYTGTIPVSGGTAPYACSITGGTLPAGLSLGANCTISGTPTATGSSTVTVKATDSANPTNNGTGPVTVTVNASNATLTLGAPPAATVNAAYTGTVPVSGGTAPYVCTLTSGTLPAGLTLGSNCVITGTPTTAGTSNVTISATDASNPVRTGSNTVPVTVNGAITLTLGQPPAATVNTAYTGVIPVTGGTAPYSCSITTGTLPAGLALGANCTITGTPTTAGSSTVTVKATDSANPSNTGTGGVTVTVNAATPSLTLGAPPAATVNVAYTGTVPVTGGTAPYVCTLRSGTLPAGLTLGSNCVITGTPTTAGTSNVTVSATDASNPARTGTATVPVTVNGAISLTLGQPPAATVNTAYTGVIPVTGGTAPYSCSITTGTLPAGLTLGANCTITGTPTTAGSSTVTVKATDSANPSNTGTGGVTVTVNGGTATLTIGNPPTATVSTAYTGTIPVAGGTGPYSCTIASGSLPTGLTLGAGCVITGTPTATGSSTVQVTATDSASPRDTSTGPSTITVQAIPTLTLTGTLPNAVLGQAYTQTLHATGGVSPYTYAVTTGALPAGLTLSSGGVISGTPTAVGASSFTVTATDSETTAQTASNPYVLLVTYPTTPNDSLLNGPYAFLFQGYDDVVAGVLAYQTASIGSFTADGTGVVSSGELESNHQGSIPAGNTIPTRSFLGTYTVGTDRRGSIAFTQLNANGTTGATTIYAISLRAPVAPATTASTGSLVEFDSDQLAGTKGTGTLLAQTASAITAGLNGSYAYGVTGDTPCLPACTVGLAAGPAAGVGQFNAAGGVITTGTADTNVAALNFPNSTLSGTYAAADGNGRVQLTLNTSGLAGTFYPTDYAAYIVDANRLLLMSTDKHSAFILQAGTATLQTQATFSSASLAAPFVGYENSPVNPGLVGQTLQNVLNLSTATVFRGTGNGNGTCTVTNVDQGGTVGLVNTLTALGSNNAVLNALLGTYQSLGNANCAVASNGRVLMNYPNPSTLLSPVLTLLGLANTPPAPRAVYLVSPNAGYFLETGYAGLGTLEAQVGSPFTLATLNGMFVYSTIPASSVATIDSSGVFTADGAGHTTSTLDENVGVGTINVLQLGVTGSANYSLTDAAAGRYLLGTSRVIYAINAGRFVLLETDLVSTSPYIALLY